MGLSLSPQRNSFVVAGGMKRNPGCREDQRKQRKRKSEKVSRRYLRDENEHVEKILENSTKTYEKFKNMSKTQEEKKRQTSETI